MAFVLSDNVKETSATTGTGTYALAGAVAGFRTFGSVMANGDTTWYAVRDGVDWEVGIGTWATGNNLARTTILASSNAGSAVSWAAGTRYIWMDCPASIVSPATTAKQGTAEFATAAEYRVGTDAARALSVAEVWAAAALAVLTDGANIAVDFSAGWNFGGASNAALGLGGNRALSAPTNLKTGQSGILWFGAVTSTRILTLNAAWLLLDGVEVGPYSITTAQELGIAYTVRDTRTYVTAIMRRAA